MSGFNIGLMLVFAFAGWQHARHLEKKYGRSPFNWPDWVWSIVCALSLLLGIILLAFAERGLRKQPGFAPAAAPAYGGHPAFGAWEPQPAAAWQPAPVGAAVAQPVVAQPVVAAPAAAPVAPAAPLTAAVPVAPAAPALPPAGWAPDPTGRHQLRWWDGATWTSAVHDNGVQGTD